VRVWPKRFWIAALWGLVATLVMTAAMGLIALVGGGRLLEPIPPVLVARIIGRAAGAATTAPAVVVLALVLHFAYGALASGFAALTTAHLNVWRGCALGLALWAVMVVFYLPMSGAETFALASDPLFWVTSLGLHLLYGAAVGVLVERHESHSEEDVVRLFSDREI